MKTIRATLPALGSYLIRFHKESQEVFDYLGKEEFRRLSNIEHLGMVSKVFTGVNHSRLEYMLLECAVVCLIKIFQRGDEVFALSGEVKLSGLDEKISSGEELLKAWFLLCNSGHAKYTFTAEAILLDLAFKHPAIKRNILLRIADKGLKKWSQDVIENRHISKFFLVLALVRIGTLEKGDRRKKKFTNLLKNLLLPEEALQDLANDDLYKLSRLKRVFSYVRLLCIVTLDAYYSHHPVRFDIMSMIMNMSNLFDTEIGSFYPLLERTAGWLADELYFHPRAIAVQRSYEFYASKKDQKLRIDRLSNETFDEEIKIILTNGFGVPDDNQVGMFKHFCRLSFRAKQSSSGMGDNTYAEAIAIKKKITNSKYINVSVKINVYSNLEHVDVLYDSQKVKSDTIAMTCHRILEWYVIRSEAEALGRIRNLASLQDRKLHGLIYRLRLRYLKEQLSRDKKILRSIFDGILAYILPEGMRGTISKFLPRKNMQYPVGYIFNYRKDGRYNTLTNELETLIRDNPNKLSAERLQELRALSYVITHSSSSFIAATLCSYQILGQDNQHVDEWDGVVVEIGDHGVRITVVEAKDLASGERNENEAYNQLEKTRSLLRSRHKFTTRRYKIPNMRVSRILCKRVFV